MQGPESQASNQRSPSGQHQQQLSPGSHLQPHARPQQVISSSHQLPTASSPDVLTGSIRQAANVAEVAGLVLSRHSAMSKSQVAMALRRMAQLTHPQDMQTTLKHPGSDEVLRLVKSRAGLFQAAATADVLWGLGRLAHMPSEQLLSSLLTALASNARTLTSAQLADSIWGMAALGHSPDAELQAAMADQAAANFSDPAHQVGIQQGDHAVLAFI